MVAHWGMSERLGPIAFRTSEEHPFLGKEIIENREFSEHTAQLIDEEAGAILRAADERARSMLSEQREKLDALAHALSEKEELDEAEIATIIGPAAERRYKKNGKAD